jgi:hypothetical protein
MLKRINWKTSPKTRLERAQQRYDAGEITWADVQAVQANLMPRCVFCKGGRPAPAYWNEQPACADCFQALYAREDRHA